jgi:hypothetical protein
MKGRVIKDGKITHVAGFTKENEMLEVAPTILSMVFRRALNITDGNRRKASLLINKWFNNSEMIPVLSSVISSIVKNCFNITPTDYNKYKKESEDVFDFMLIVEVNSSLKSKKESSVYGDDKPYDRILREVHYNSFIENYEARKFEKNRAIPIQKTKTQFIFPIVANRKPIKNN